MQVRFTATTTSPDKYHMSPSRLSSHCTNTSLYYKTALSFSRTLSQLSPTRVLSPITSLRFDRHAMSSTTSMPTSNKSAVLPSARSHPFQINSSPIVQPSQPNEILIRNHAIAINPIDFKLQKLGHLPLTYPTVLGEDLAGVVVAISPDLQQQSASDPHAIKVGNRVLACAPGFDTKKNEHKAFQEYTIGFTDLTARIPDSMSFEQAVSVPLGIATASSGIFESSGLGLRKPTATSRADASASGTKEVVLISGGASAVGGNAVQLAAAAGYTVLATCSAKNFDAVKGLGASAVFDYNEYTSAAEKDGKTEFVSKMLAAVPQGGKVAGVFDAVGQTGWGICAEFITRAAGDGILSQGFEGNGNKVVTAARGWSEPTPYEVEIKLVYSMSIIHSGVGKDVFGGFLSAALAKGAYKAWPEPMVVGSGLDKLQDAVDAMGKGVSAKKIVVII